MPPGCQPWRCPLTLRAPPLSLSLLPCRRRRCGNLSQTWGPGALGRSTGDAEPGKRERLLGAAFGAGLGRAITRVYPEGRMRGSPSLFKVDDRGRSLHLPPLPTGSGGGGARKEANVCILLYSDRLLYSLRGVRGVQISAWKRDDIGAGGEGEVRHQAYGTR